MRVAKRFNSVYLKLIASYTILILVVALILGSTWYIYFFSNFNKQVKIINQRMLDYLRNTTEIAFVERVEIPGCEC